MADVVEKVLNIFNNNWNSQVILYGPPGTSKTYSSNIIAATILAKSSLKNHDSNPNSDTNKPESIISEALKEINKTVDEKKSISELAQLYLDECGKQGRFKLVQFHPSYSYEDFVRGIQIKPDETAKSGIKYEVEPKIIEKFAEGCDENNPKVLVIDEINRAPLGSVLGELIYGLEYRGEAISTSYDLIKNDVSVELKIPKGLYIIGTMNTADRSIGSMDYAVRRRFAFVQVPSNPDCIKGTWDNKEVDGKLAEKLYDYLIANEEGLFDKDLLQGTDIDVEDIKIGHTYFLGKPGQGVDFLKYRLEYQVYPIYLEYMKDGLIKLDEGKRRFNKLINDSKFGEDFKKWASTIWEIPEAEDK